MKQNRIFIAASQPVKEKKLERIIASSGAEFDVRIRQDYYLNGAIDLKALYTEAKQICVGLFLFEKKDFTASERTNKSNWNDLVMEAVFFAGVLGIDRVVIIREKGVDIPACLEGLNIVELCLQNETMLNSNILNFLRKEVPQNLKRLPHHDDLKLPVIKDGNFGFKNTLTYAFSDVAKTISLLDGQTFKNCSKLNRPLFFDSNSLCISTYVEALKRVSSKFWATTLLSSGFWTNNNPEILDANHQAIMRIKKNGGSIRKLFLLQRLPSEEINKWKDELIRSKKYRDEDGQACLEKGLLELYKNIGSLVNKGCDIKVVFDNNRLDRTLPEEIALDFYNSELAIYDDWRLDQFRGSQLNTISSVKCFTPLFNEFDAYRRKVDEYFDNLWDKAKPMMDFLDLIKEAMKVASMRIDYQPSWLARYDFGLPKEDELLKIVELSRVKEVLRRLKKWGEIERYLDVGTCTGRYLINLRGAIRKDGEIIGVDNDIDSVRFAHWNVERECSYDPRIVVQYKDFCSEEIPFKGKFELITCMLGTLMHFGVKRTNNPPYEDSLQFIINRFKSLLTKGGSFFFSVWSDEACKKTHMLSIYSKDEMERMRQWTPSRNELQSRLKQAGLSFEQPYPLEERLDLYHCRNV